MTRARRIRLRMGLVLAGLTFVSATVLMPVQDADAQGCGPIIPASAQKIDLRIGQPVSIQIGLSAGCNNPAIKSIRFYAVGMPNQLRINAESGLISGTVTEHPMPVLFWTIGVEYELSVASVAPGQSPVVRSEARITSTEVSSPVTPPNTPTVVVVRPSAVPTVVVRPTPRPTVVRPTPRPTVVRPTPRPTVARPTPRPTAVVVPTPEQTAVPTAVVQPTVVVEPSPLPPTLDAQETDVLDAEAVSALINGVMVDIWLVTERDMTLGIQHGVTVHAVERIIGPAPVPNVPADEGIPEPHPAPLRRVVSAKLSVEPSLAETSPDEWMTLVLRSDGPGEPRSWRHRWGVTPKTTSSFTIHLLLVDPATGEDIDQTEGIKIDVNRPNGWRTQWLGIQIWKLLLAVAGPVSAFYLGARMSARKTPAEPDVDPPLPEPSEDAEAVS